MKIFDSRDEAFRRPFGALPQGTAMETVIRPPRQWGVTKAFLIAIVDDTGETREIAMTRRRPKDDHDIFAAKLSTEGILGLVWYRFRLERGDEPPYEYGNNDAGLGGEGQVDGGRSYQLTVYDGNCTAPDWYGKSVTYHIFPDRFARKGTLPGLATMIGNRVLHKNWDDTPDFLPNLVGEITNSDFFGGNIAGILDKLDYLAELGVGTLYLSPIFEAASNHRYDTADYHAIDPLFGDAEQFQTLCAEAEKRGIRVMLDGVFNHTGFDSRYFNGRGSYPEPGAYQSKDSPYYPWYDFSNWPHEYSSWWGVYTLPQIKEDNEDYIRFLMDGPDSVLRKWLRLGACGWRLDVVDEVPDHFVAKMRESIRAEKPDAVLIGEVWEDASNKVAYGVRRRYFLGDELDGVMNYPFRNALLAFLLGGQARDFRQSMECLRENYPPFAHRNLMNFLGTHDTPRILTVLGSSHEDYQQSKAQRAYMRLTPEQRDSAAARLKMGALILFAFPGSPCVFYGDEAGLEGYEDPLNRRTYPWGREDQALLDWYKKLGQLRKNSPALQRGDIAYHLLDEQILCFARRFEGETIVAAANNDRSPRELRLPWPWASAIDQMTGRCYPAENGVLCFTLEGLTAVLLGRG